MEIILKNIIPRWNVDRYIAEFTLIFGCLQN